MAAAITHITPSHMHACGELHLPVSPGKATLKFEEGAPCNFFYLHLHDAIRAELLVLEAAVKELLREEQPEGLNEGLAALQERYIFLVHIYKYHSSVEDEVRRVSGHAFMCHYTAFIILPNPRHNRTHYDQVKKQRMLCCSSGNISIMAFYSTALFLWPRHLRHLPDL